jgi:hypothetical protein
MLMLIADAQVRPPLWHLCGEQDATRFGHTSTDIAGTQTHARATHSMCGEWQWWRWVGRATRRR